MYLSEEIFLNPYTLNIFCDASMRYYQKDKNFGDGCYGAIAYCENNKIDSLYRVCSNTTSGNAEIKAVRNAVILALRYKFNYSTINIFSDSQISIFGIRDRIFNWRISSDNQLMSVDNTKIRSQEIFIEIMNMITTSGIYINFYHQKGHVKTNNFNSLVNAAHVFESSNNIRDGVDFNLIRYISINNNKVDDITGNILAKHDKSKIIQDALVYEVTDNFRDMKNQYRNQINNGGICNGRQNY